MWSSPEKKMTQKLPTIEVNSFPREKIPEEFEFQVAASR